MRLLVLLSLLGVFIGCAFAQSFDFDDVNSGDDGEELTCYEKCNESGLTEADVVCACGREYLSSCQAECAGYRIDEIFAGTCHDKHCKQGGDPCDDGSGGTAVCTPVRQQVTKNECVGAGYSCVKAAMLLACPMSLQNLNGAVAPFNYNQGVCLTVGDGKYWAPNQIFAKALGLDAIPEPCSPFTGQNENGESEVFDPIFFYNQGKGALNYYYNFDNDTAMVEYGDKILEDTCGCDYNYNPVRAIFTEFCLSFWNQCLLDCKKKKYEDRIDSYFKDPNYRQENGECKDPCASTNGNFPCSGLENCYPIKNQARCFKTFDKQYDCMTKNCPDWNSTEPAKNPVCVKIYAGVRIDNVYRGGGSPSAYTYRSSCMATCEGFRPGDWEEGSCSDLAVSDCENKCQGTPGGKVCAEVQVQIQDELFDDSDNNNLIVTGNFETQRQTMPNQCVSECLGWTSFTQGECVGSTESVEAWGGYGGLKCKDYAEDAGNDNFQNFCDDMCVGDGCDSLPNPKLTACEACLECRGAPACPLPDPTGFTTYANMKWTSCADYDKNKDGGFYAYCDQDVHSGPDPNFTNQRACDACSQCADNPKCLNTGWKGPDNRICSDYSLPKNKLSCHKDFYSGTDPSFKGQSACDACDECKQGNPNKVCTAPSSGFFGGDLASPCSYYSQGDNWKYCQDEHFGPDQSLRGKTACDACNECSNSKACRGGTTGFVGYEFSTCDDYSATGANRNFCHKDKHEGVDFNFFGKTACESCNQCNDFWGCRMSKNGFAGYEGKTCADYGREMAEYCYDDYHIGEDPNYKNQNACSACNECNNQIACNAKIGFYGFKRKYTCADYASAELQGFCRDRHEGDDPAFSGKTACDACSECSNARVCQDDFFSKKGYCNELNTGKNSADCIGEYLGYGGPSKWTGTKACTACPQCTNAPVCQDAFWSEGFICSDYSGVDRDFCSEDTHSHDNAPSVAKGSNACRNCPTECNGAPGC